MKLNDEQQFAINSMLDFIKKGKENIFCLIGPAGTGKSFTIQHLVELLPKKTRVCFTAPTNKAVRVLKTMSESKGLSVKCITIHSLLGLKVETKGGAEVLKIGGRNNIKDFDLVVIDEISMINEELLGYIEQSIQMKAVQLILMGDEAQLPPIGEKDSRTFSFKNRCHLTKVVRQRSENPILGLCSDIRLAIENGATTIPPVLSATNEAGNIGIHVMKGDRFTKWMPSAFSSEKFDCNFDKYRVVAWRNKTVESYNRIIQQLRYGQLNEPFAIGEPVVFSNPLYSISTDEEYHVEKKVVNGWDSVIVSTESEGKIEQIKQIEPFYFSPTKKQIDKGFHFESFVLSRYFVTCRVSGHDEPISCTVTACHKELYKLLDFIVSHITQNHLDWTDYWKVKRLFTDIRPAYAMTAHKSQGSTFENVFVDAQDILVNPNREEALRCLYVAVSRASHNVILNI